MASIDTTQIGRSNDRTPEAIRSELEALLARNRDDHEVSSDDELEPVMRQLIEKIAPTRADLDVLIDRFRLQISTMPRKMTSCLADDPVRRHRPDRAVDRPERP